MQQEQRQQHRCDRRRSRAARTILMNKTLPILQKYNDDYPTSRSRKNSGSHQAQMKTYEAVISGLLKNVNTCIISPKRDIFWNEEFQYTTAKYSRQLTSTLHRCALCGKTFLSRYYLDLHIESSHEDDVAHNTNEICPANEICKLLGGKICDREALDKEPFYAPGIHSSGKKQQGNGHISQTVLRDFQRKLHDQPCNETALEESRQYCIESINNCFKGMDNLIEDISGTLCETQTCHYHLHTLHSMFEGVDALKGQWDRHHDEMHEIGLGLILVCVAGSIGLIWRHSATIADLCRRKRKIEFDLEKRKNL